MHSTLHPNTDRLTSVHSIVVQAIAAIIAGGKKVLFMDGTLLVALLQPPPETYDLFDDVMLLSQGQVVFHGPKDEVTFSLVQHSELVPC